MLKNVSKVKILSRGSTGRTIAKNIKEQLAMKEAMINPLKNSKQFNTIIKDTRWLAKDGWLKMSKIVNGVEIHYVYNKILKVFDDFKFKY